MAEYEDREFTPSHSMNPSEIHLHVGEILTETNGKLAERILYNQACKKRSTWNLAGNEDIILGPMPFRGNWEGGDYRAEIIPKE